MIELYPQIKALHVIAVLASGSLFLLRGLLVRAGRQARPAIVRVEPQLADEAPEP